jgi:nitrate/TMAO reductase-like tetraheme cytochrome c subunit
MRRLGWLLLIAACTASSHATIDRTDCVSCHKPDYDETPSIVQACTPTDHVAAGYTQTCSNCHGTTSWCPGDAKHTKWDLTTASHAGWDCADCHTAITYDPPAITDPGATGINCIGCHWHDQARVDPYHTGKSGYQYGPATCLASECHGGKARQ